MPAILLGRVRQLFYDEIKEMKVYKFRTTENLNFVLDILINSRLFCCPVESLSDICEADVRVGNDRDREKEIITYGEEVTAQLKSLRVSALTKSFDNHVLWAQYAGGYTGVAIEADLDDTDVTEVTYSDSLILLAELIDSHTPEAAARVVLARKYEDWRFEGEVRVMTKSEFYALRRPIPRVIVGSRCNPVIVETLRLTCRNLGIPVERMVVSDRGIYSVDVQAVR